MSTYLYFCFVVLLLPANLFLYLFIKSALYRYQFVSVLYRIPTIFSCQNSCYLISFLIFQLSGESSTCFRVGPFTPIFVFGIKDCLFIFFLAPIIPADRKDMFPQLTTNKYSLCIRTPRTGQIYFLGFRLCCQPAIVEDIAVLFPFIGRRSSDIAIAFAMNVTAIKNSDRPAENKIDCSFNIAIFVILTALLPICVESILEAEETAVLKIDTVGDTKQATACPTGPDEFSKVIFSA